MNNIKVIEEWILVKPEKAENKKEQKVGSIIIPAEVQKMKEVVKKAEVVQISEDIYDILKKEGKVAQNASDGEVRDALKYKVGDTVLFYGKTGIPIQNEEYMFLKYDGMLAIEVNNEKN